MPVLADPIVSALVAEFRKAVEKLSRSGEHGNVTDAARIGVIKQLCELSRDARFHLGPREYAEPEQLEEVATCFESAVEAIRGLNLGEATREQVEAYCENILERARRCRD